MTAANTDQIADVRGVFSRLIASDRFADILRVSLSLIGVAAFCFLAGRMHAIVALMLGVIACALAEPDDSGWRRLGSLIVTLICFSGTAVIVELLDDYPPLFALGLVTSTFALSMLGAVSARWGQVATGTLILAVYTMIGMEQQAAGGRDLVSTPLYLTCGAVWYGLFSLAWSMVAPMNAVRQALANLFEALAVQVACVARLFEPYRETDHGEARLKLAAANSKSVAALNVARLALLDRLWRRRRRGDSEEKMRLYFAAQDIHERIHSTHYPHEELVEVFFHSDLLFRCGHLLQLQAGALRELAAALRARSPLPKGEMSRAAFLDAREALDLACRNDPPAHLVAALNGLMGNVVALQNAIERPLSPDIAGQILQDPDPATFREAFVRLRNQLTPRSGWFRHAVRLSAGLLLGYLFLKLARLEHGHWIMLTTLLVGQQSFGATRRRLVERVIGTVVGVVAGWAVLQLVPQQPLQLAVIVLAGVGFFAWRRRRYPAATAMITLFVILGFEQILSGYAVIGPRLFDTLIGVAIALAMFYFVLPDWKVRRLADCIAGTLGANARYLRCIAGQYVSGRADDLAYRIARRDAHNAHAAFDVLVRDILGEPRYTATKTDAALHALGLAYNLLSYLSAMGAHRAAGVMGEGDPLRCGVEAVAARLEALAAAYRNGDFASLVPPSADPLVPQIGELRRLIAQQLERVTGVCTALAALGPALRGD
jgi:YccS/YhfK family integral membrane protein